MRKYFLPSVFIALILFGLIFYQGSNIVELFRRVILLSGKQTASVAALVQSPFTYLFKVEGILDEARTSEDSSSPYWWLNSGGELRLKDGLGQTVQGELWQLNKWRLAYNISNPIDTDGGFHPQNIFRLVTRSSWQNFQEEVYFRITKDNLSTSPNRNASNGLLFFLRYTDSDNLYYAGIRVDGAAVIKKKINGDYFTMDYKKVFPGNDYNILSNPNLLPKNTWVGMRASIKNLPDGSVEIKLFTDVGEKGIWTQVASARDNGTLYGGKSIIERAPGGIRTDFMNVQFKQFKLTTIP